jgi:hypothetical protein
VSTQWRKFPRTAGIAVAGMIAAAAVFTAPASAKSPTVPPAFAKSSAANCGDMPYRDRTQAPNNSAGLIFVPRGDTFRIWDNVQDNHLVRIWFNYAGVNDKWKYVGAPSDGGQGPIIRNVAERYSQICFYVHTDSPRYGDSPIVRYTTRP